MFHAATQTHALIAIHSCILLESQKIATVDQSDSHTGKRSQLRHAFCLNLKKSRNCRSVRLSDMQKVATPTCMENLENLPKTLILHRGRVLILDGTGAHRFLAGTQNGVPFCFHHISLSFVGQRREMGRCPPACYVKTSCENCGSDALRS